MSILSAALSVPLILEFTFAPINLITGRNAHLFTEFTGLTSRPAMLTMAALNAAGAGLLTVGLINRQAAVLGALIIGGVSAWYLIMMMRNGHAGIGVPAFLLTGALAVGILLERTRARRFI
ncbi:MAG: hypothetical protein ACRDVE_06885 [Actinocrinis sp.]